MIKSLKDLLDKFSRFTNSLVYDGGICKRLISFKLSIMRKLLNGMSIEEIIPMNINMSPILRYFNVIVYPLTFLFAIKLI